MKLFPGAASVTQSAPRRRWNGRAGPEPGILQEGDDGIIEGVRILDAAGVSRPGHDDVASAFDAGRGFPSGGKRIVVRAIDHERGKLDLRQPSAHVAAAAGAVDLA